MKTYSIPRLAVLLSAVAPVLMLAQSTTSGNSDQPLELSPFSVKSERDYGYQASTSITATGIGTKIADIPAKINVITKDFLNDTGLDELRFAVRTISSVDADARILDRLTINVRGLPATIQQGGYDNSFLAFENVDRIEVIKGPSAVFNGNVVPGGLINVIKAEPDFKPAGYLEASYGTFSYRKAKISATGLLISDVLAFNIYGSYLDKGSHDEYAYEHQKFLAGGLKWRPVKKLTSTFSFEIERETYEGVPEEQSGSNKAFLAAVNAGTVPYLQTSRAWLNSNPLYGTTTLDLDTVATSLIYPYRGFNPLGPNAPSTLDGYNLHWETTLQATDALSFLAGYNYTDNKNSYIDFNTFRPVAGKIPGELLINSNYQRTDLQSRTLVARVEAVYKFSFFHVNQNLVVGAQDQINKSYSRIVKGPTIVWNPRTQPALDGVAQIASAFPNGFPALPPYQTSISRAYYVADQITAFSDRLHILLGARDSKLSNATGLRQSKVTPEFGALFKVIPMVSVYANYSETFLPNYILDGLGNQLGPTTGKGHDYGLKFELPNGKLSATAAIYQEDYANLPVRDFPLEAATHVQPLYILSGLQRTAGFESDLTYSPTRNFQLVGSFNDSWEHRTVVSATPLQNNVPLNDVPKYAVKLWGKYTFINGPLSGFYIGAGGKAVSRMRLHNSYDVGIYGPGYALFNASLGYEKKLKRFSYHIQYNLDNLTDRSYFDGVYQLGDPRTHRLTVRLSF